ncbi:extracellular solute-binding protein [Paenibacillus sp. PR3]|uniref:Extracellular solute-binding protein n=1 Tax=Paenibacillus terricola TaxID=2763503 RepID=A0ABR8N388_9BACL|nr:extracellular solute-binding protein [Paenibacillus terricola]MBD3922315.1 extracellular solute-binding protein [Paenibacillus terricola]
MMKKRIPILAAVFLLLSASIFSACSKDQEDKPDPNETYQLSFAASPPLPGVTMDLLKKQFPEITFEFVSLNPTQMKQRIEANDVPDIIMDIDRVTIPQELFDKVQYDMTPLIQQSEIDLNAFEPGLIDHVRSYGTGEQIYALPYSRYLYALYYNKTVFDQVGVPYPTDGMTWTDTLNLAKQFSNKMNIHGLEPIFTDLSFVSLIDQRGLSFLDAGTDRAQVDSDGWKQLFENIREIYSIAGNGMEYAGNVRAFTEQGKIAMALGYGLDFLQGGSASQDIDLVSFPTLDDVPSVGPGNRTLNLMLTAQSKNKQKAMEVIQYLLSPDVQLQNSKNGIAPVLADSEIMRAYGTEVQSIQGKHLEAFFQNKLPNIGAISPYEGTAYLTAGPFFQKAIDREQNLSEVLSAMKLAIDKSITELKNHTTSDLD